MAYQIVGSEINPLPLQDGNVFEPSFGQRAPLKYSTPRSQPKNISADSIDAKGSSTLQNSKWKILFAIVILVIPAPFLVLAGEVLRFNRQSVSNESLNNFGNGTRIAATLFPIVFAAIVGQFMTQAARWSLERGSSLGTLEQLMGSRSVFSALYTQFILRAANILGVSIAILWVLSPLGGQAALRILNTGFKEVDYSSSVIVFDSAAQGEISNYLIASEASADAVKSQVALLNSLYTASLMTTDTVKRSTMDLWDNVKIPYLTTNSGFSSSMWIDIPQDGTAVYSSLIGIPMLSMPIGNNSFFLESSYIDLQCSNISTSGNFIELNDTFLSGVPFLCFSIEECMPLPNGTFQGFNGDKNTTTTWNLGIDTFVDSYWRNSTIMQARGMGTGEYDSPGTDPRFLFNQTGIKTSQATLLLQSYNVQGQMYTGPEITYTTAYCKVSQVYVESRVRCQTMSTARSCSVEAQRPSQKPHVSSNITLLSWPENFYHITDQPLATGQTGLGGISDPALYYINDTSIKSLTYTGEYAIIDNVPDDLFSQRFGQVLNAYVMISQMSTMVVGAPQTFPNISSPITTSHLVEIYIVSVAWMITFIIALSMLFAAAVGNIIFTNAAISPDVLGYSSLALRDSKYAGLPLGNGPRDGSSLTNDFKRQQLKFGVVDRTDTGIGILGIAHTRNVARVRKNVEYL